MELAVPDTYLVFALVAAQLVSFYGQFIATEVGGRAPRQQARQMHKQSEDFEPSSIMTSQAGKEATIEKWMRRKGCGRPEAMRLVVEDEEWRRDNR